jgi:hypothetical protein
MEPVSIITLVGVGLLIIERVVTLIFNRVKSKSKCSNCCEVDTEYNNNNTKDESTINTNNIQKTI